MHFAEDLWPHGKGDKEASAQKRIKQANESADVNRTYLMKDDDLGFGKKGHIPIAVEAEGPQHKRNWVARLCLILPGISPVTVSGKAAVKKDAENLCLDSAVEYMKGLEELENLEEPSAKRQALEAAMKPGQFVPAKPAYIPGVEPGVYVSANPVPVEEIKPKSTLGENKQFLVRSGIFGKGPGTQLPLIMSHEGPQHERVFICQLKVPLATVMVATGKAKNKKGAESLCVEHAVDILEENGFTNQLRGVGSTVAQFSKKRKKMDDDSPEVQTALQNSDAQARLFASFARMDSFDAPDPEPPKAKAKAKPGASKPKQPPPSKPLGAQPAQSSGALDSNGDLSALLAAKKAALEAAKKAAMAELNSLAAAL